MAPSVIGPAWQRAATFVFVVLATAGCLDADAVRIDQPIVPASGWAPTDLRVLDPLTYEAGPRRPEREPAIAINPTDSRNVIAVTTEEVQTPRYESWLRFFASEDGGNNWTEIRVLDNPERPGAVGDPSLVFGADGTAYFAYLSANGLGIDRSSDRGRNWDFVAETAIRGRDPTTDRCSSPDKQLLTIDRATDTLYMVWTRFSHACAADDIPGHPTVNQIAFGELAMEVVISSSMDRGETWTVPELVYDRSAIGAVPLVGPDGHVHVAMWASLETNERNTYCASDYGLVVSSGRDQHAAIVVQSSPNGRGPWRTHIQPICHLNIGPAAIATTGATTFAGYGFIAPTAAVDATRNMVHVAYIDSPIGSTRAGVWEIHSDVAARTWSRPQLLGGTPDLDGFLPALATDAGTTHLLYSQRTTEDRYAEYYRSSSDGGSSWSTPMQLSRSDYEITGDNIGDYNWIDASGGRVVAIWTGTAAPGVMQVWSRVGAFERNAV